MPSRLYTLSPQLDSAFEQAAGPQRREAVLLACHCAVDRLPVADSIIRKGLEDLQRDEAAEQTIDALKQFIEQKDEIYFGLLEQQGEVTREALVYFSEARVASALLTAISSEPNSWNEAIYEAAMSMDDAVDIVRRVQQLL